MTRNALSIILASTLVVGFLTSSATQAEQLTANAGVTNNYLWRGIEQTGGKSAVFGGLDYTSDSGFYAGMWASNADWGTEMTYELDLYGGFASQLNDLISYDIGFKYYGYPDEKTSDVDFTEVYVNIGIKGLTLGAAVLIDADNASAGDSLYLSADYSFALPHDSEVTLHLASYSGDWLSEDVIDYGISLSKSNITLGLSKTDLSDDELKLYIAYTVTIDL